MMKKVKKIVVVLNRHARDDLLGYQDYSFI